MAGFLKLDRTDEDAFVTTTFEADDLNAAVEMVFQEALVNDRLEPCHGKKQAECFSKSGNSIQWIPGDGGVYTVFVVAPDTPEGLKELDQYCC